MPKETSGQMISWERARGRSKILAIGVAVAAVVAAWYGVSWQIGNMLAELTPPSQPDSQEVAQLAVALAPSDPATRWLVATKEKEKFSPESIENATRLFEDVVRRSPNDYRWWIELGRSNEQAEQTENAEAAFGRAAQLAPNFTFPHWQLGNFYLRQNRTEDAFAELKKATEGSLLYRDQVFSLAWDYFDKDPAKVEELAADTPDVKASLALFFAVRNSPVDALRVWNTLPDEEKAAHPVIAKSIAQGFFDKQFYRESLEFARQSGLDPEARAETISNGGFESFIGADDSLYSWKVNRNDGKLDIATDSSVKHTGARSIRFAFRGYAKPVLSNLSQFVAVQASKKYRISFWVRTENLRSGGSPQLEIANANDATLLAVSHPFAGSSNEWEQITLDIVTPANCSGIVIRTGRQSCGECPIFGTFWYDDFSIVPQ
ncbi:MAG: carbohydrate binding domain-containing protein [Acidobacteriota bacterium]